MISKIKILIITIFILNIIVGCSSKNKIDVIKNQDQPSFSFYKLESNDNDFDVKDSYIIIQGEYNYFRLGNIIFKELEKTNLKELMNLKIKLNIIKNGQERTMLSYESDNISFKKLSEQENHLISIYQKNDFFTSKLNDDNFETKIKIQYKVDNEIIKKEFYLTNINLKN